MKRLAAFLAVPFLLAAAPTALVTGAVRDQYGEPVQGALVTAQGARATTDADGTFALEIGGAKTVEITCAYCAPTAANVASDGTVIAIVRRYDALRSAAPSARDLASLPYAHAESALALRPFTLLNDSAGAIPGPRISTYGASAPGGLLIDDGIPQYDIAAGVTAWRALPGFVLKNADVRDPADAFRYGDMAGGGTFSVNTHTAERANATAIAGSENAAGAAGTVSYASYNFALSSNASENRSRVDASAGVPVGGDTLSLGALASRDGFTPENAGSIAESALGVRALFQSAGPAHAYAGIIADRSGYNIATAAGTPVEGFWGDVTAQGGVSTSTPIRLFATIGARESTAYYDASALGVPRIAGTVAQTQTTIGAQRSGDRYSYEAGVSVFSIGYAGGILGVSHPMSATLLTPSVNGSYAFDAHWSYALSAGEAFRLPSLLETYANAKTEPDLSFDQYGSIVQTLSYTDSVRFRASAFALSERVSNLDEGTVHSEGLQAAWQIAPALSLRAWTMHVNDNTQTEYPIVRFGHRPEPATVGSMWLTYDVPGGMRIDAVYRNDLIDYAPDRHFDASVSGPVNGALRWFASSERVHGNRYFGAGLKIDVP